MQIKNCIKNKTKFLLYLLKNDHAKMKSFIAAFLEALTYYQCWGNLMMPKGAKDTERQIRPHPILSSRVRHSCVIMNETLMSLLFLIFYFQRVLYLPITRDHSETRLVHDFFYRAPFNETFSTGCLHTCVFSLCV